MTNREKLASMTDEELAKYVCDLDKMCSGPVCIWRWSCKRDDQMAAGRSGGR